MKKLIILLIIILGLIVPAKSFAWFDKWTTEDTILQAGFIGLMIIDWGQTNWISDHPVIIEYYGEMNSLKRKIYHEESNLILGKHPSKKKIATYFSSCIIGHTAISYILPKLYRNLWQCVGIGIEIHATADNYFNCNVKFNF